MGTSEKLARQHWMARWMKTRSQGREYQGPVADQDPVMTAPGHQSAAPPCPDSHLGSQRSHGASGKDLSGFWLPCRHQGLSCGAPCVLAFSPEDICCRGTRAFLTLTGVSQTETDGKTINLAPVQQCFSCFLEVQVSWVPLRSIPLAETSPSYTPGAQHMPTRWVERVDGRSSDQPSSSDRSDFQTTVWIK